MAEEDGAAGDRPLRFTCAACDWSIVKDGEYDAVEVIALVGEHNDETGHTIVADD